MPAEAQEEPPGDELLGGVVDDLERLRGFVTTAVDRFPDKGVALALECAIGASEYLTEQQAPLIAAARTCARRLDMLEENGGLDDNGRPDNTTLKYFRDYCNDLGLAVGEARSEAAKPKSEGVARGVAKFRLVTGADGA